ncbi:hypothetical protein PABG_03373 [Paracoccidioides brasiliensis Pb03]|uniref:Uncharacterized protein n=2 Tax=Paracoccidioides brasiliensis TaxID=121759 RepID=C1G4S3_PARBD|nr:uncharacterized protein PADG_01939 [Paracoccidioides brasiliensis Pb18]EEH21142.2 hypothetical protein PABG_03373 [Paracoccidioides brasiliensis Pb03]EEH45789.2 hypothetical protein PADG_01939 [Paracoccidioides brasiliensis Pb18]ODH33136.1 hypothetical protein ACO22_03328 [Paracoccidioides brasiliensis]ODH53047.1 hypothetical protein GX48_00917 [Paracoccidioides brasiliensis]
MFMPGPPQLSEAEVKAGEKEAAQTIKAVITGSILLYLCKLDWAGMVQCPII